jgi:hypothetical protein
MFAVIAVTIVAILAVGGCKRKPVDVFPKSGVIDGWEKSSDTRVFEAKDLWQFIDGDSEQYIQAGVVSTSTSDYKYRGQMEVVVDVYTMKNADGARAIFDKGKTNDAKKLALGDDGVQFAQSVTFRKHNYLVRIVSYQVSSISEQALFSLAHGIEANL